MIVVDTNVIVYLYLPTDFTASAESLLEHDPDWAAPILWRSGLRNVLALYLRKGLLDLRQACAIQAEAETLLSGNEYEVDSPAVLERAGSSGCAAYDCEFVALADHLQTKLVTMDRQVLSSFSGTAVSLDPAVAG